MNLISPKTGLNFVKVGIKKTLKQDIEDFDIIYRHAEQKIDIRVYNYKDKDGIIHEKKVFKYDESDKLFLTINHMLKTKLKPGHEIVRAIISYSQLVVIMTTNKNGLPDTNTIKL